MSQSLLTQDNIKEIEDLIKQGQKALAVSKVNAITKLGLRLSKNYVDDIERKLAPR